MAAYADFLFYRINYKGSLIENEKKFEKLANKASFFIDEQTLNRIKEPDKNIKMAVCQVAEILFREETQNNTNQIASESVGPHSVSYVRNLKTAQEFQNEKIQAVRMYLSGTGLLYRGLPSWNL